MPRSLIIAGLLFGFLRVDTALGWSGLGHRIVTETATLLLQQEAPQNIQSTLRLWGDLLARHRMEMGIYSFYPDTVYRHHDQHAGAVEGPTHFFDLSLLFAPDPILPKKSASLKAIPENYEEAKSQLVRKLGEDGFLKLGSAPWRIEQFLELAWRELKPIHKFSGGYVSGEKATGDLSHLFKALYFLGIMAHYSGDISVPYHAAMDSNGGSSGEAGIHFYYEGDCVGVFEPDLASAVLLTARKHAKGWLRDWGTSQGVPVSPLHPILKVILQSGSEIAEISRIDREKVVLKPPRPKGETGTTEWAKRKTPETGCGHFKKYLVTDLARGSVLTAYLWSLVLPQTTDLSEAQGLQFADLKVGPSFVEPSYAPITFPGSNQGASWTPH